MENIQRNEELNSKLSSCNSSTIALNKNAHWCSDSTIPVPSFTVTAPPFDRSSSESKHSYFPRKFSLQAFRKLSGSSVSRDE